MSDSKTKDKHIDEIDDFYSQKLREAGQKIGEDAGNISALAPDYDQNTLAKLPEGITQTSFGCGDPSSFAGMKQGDTIVDLGCGTGLDLLIAAEKVGPMGRVIGIDMSEEMAEKARSNIAKTDHKNIEVHVSRIEDLPINDAIIDWAISNCVINLAADKVAVFKEISRVLRPDGQILISDLVADNLPAWVHTHKDLYAACISSVISEKEYLTAVETAGLGDVKTVHEMIYDEAQIRVLVKEELPIAINELAAKFGKTEDETLDFVANDLANCIKSVKVYGRR